eukprot:GHVS01019888.1.p1 GENE.GHVS01019888.1~~GHVS01019888.1.p1  ORF type:complete len:392 (+),score=71.71 GHVS01019888.1:205-1380(+)
MPGKSSNMDAKLCKGLTKYLALMTRPAESSEPFKWVYEGRQLLEDLINGGESRDGVLLLLWACNCFKAEETQKGVGTLARAIGMLLATYAAQTDNKTNCSSINHKMDCSGWLCWIMGATNMLGIVESNWSEQGKSTKYLYLTQALFRRHKQAPGATNSEELKGQLFGPAMCDGSCGVHLRCVLWSVYEEVFECTAHEPAEQYMVCTFYLAQALLESPGVAAKYCALTLNKHADKILQASKRKGGLAKNKQLLPGWVNVEGWVRITSQLSLCFESQRDWFTAEYLLHAALLWTSDLKSTSQLQKQVAVFYSLRLQASYEQVEEGQEPQPMHCEEEEVINVEEIKTVLRERMAQEAIKWTRVSTTPLDFNAMDRMMLGGKRNDQEDKMGKYAM